VLISRPPPAEPKANSVTSPNIEYYKLSGAAVYVGTVYIRNIRSVDSVMEEKQSVGELGV